MESIHTASANSVWELVWWYVPEDRDGFSGRWLRCHVERGPEVSERSAGRRLRHHDSEVSDGSLEDGSVVTWKGVLKFLKGLLEDGSVVTTLKFLMGSLGDGSVVTWGGF